MRLRRTLLLPVLVGLFASAPAPSADPLVVLRLSPQQPLSPVVQVAAFFGAQPRPGSGILIHPSGLLLTVSHVLHNVSRACTLDPHDPLVQRGPDGVVILLTEEEGQPPVPRFVAEVLVDRPDRDLALLRITGRVLNDFRSFSDLVRGIGQLEVGPLEEPLGLPAWAPWDAEVLTLQPEPGRVDAVTPWGYPARAVGGAPTTLSVSAPKKVLRIDEAAGLFEVELGSAPGMSGGPVTAFDEVTRRHRVVGVLCAIGAAGAGGARTQARRINAAVDLLEQAEQRLGVRINRAPVARFNFTPRCPEGATEGCPAPGELITFDASASFDPDGAIVRYVWEIQDGDQPLQRVESEEPLLRHTFTSPKADVTLIVEDEGGLAGGTTEPKVVLRRRVLTCQARIEGREGSFTTIGEALAQAGSGDTILVSGECQEVLTLTKGGLTLRGEGPERPVILGNGRDPVITVAADDVTLEGLTLRDGSQGVRVRRSFGFTLRGSVVEDNGNEGVAVQEGEATLVENRIVQNKGAGVSLEGSARLVASGRLEGNRIEGNGGGGVRLEKAKSVTLTGNIIEGNIAFGLLIRGSEEVALEAGNQVLATRRDAAGELGHGIIVEENSQVTISDSRIEDNEGAGVFVRGALVEIEDTVISGNQARGLRILDGSRAEIRKSRILRNRSAGISIRASRATIRGNEISQTQPDPQGFARGINIEDAGESLQDPWVLILENTLTDNADEGLIVFQSAVEIRGNEIINNVAIGIDIRSASQARIVGNRIFGTKPGPRRFRLGTGIEVDEDSEAYIERNTISENARHGIGLFGGSTAGIVENTITGNRGFGIFADASSRVTECRGNTFSGNSKGDFSPNLQGRCSEGSYPIL